MDFGDAIRELKNGNCVTRKGWNGAGLFVCKQIPSEIPSDVIPRMQSLPESAKQLFLNGNDANETINYENQMIISSPVSREINSWVPSSSDIFAEDWMLV